MIPGPAYAPRAAKPNGRGKAGADGPMLAAFTTPCDAHDPDAASLPARHRPALRAGRLPEDRSPGPRRHARRHRPEPGRCRLRRTVPARAGYLDAAGPGQ